MTNCDISLTPQAPADAGTASGAELREALMVILPRAHLLHEAWRRRRR